MRRGTKLVTAPADATGPTDQLAAPLTIRLCPTCEQQSSCVCGIPAPATYGAAPT